MCNIVQLCVASNDTLLMCKWNRVYLLLGITLVWKMADQFAFQIDFDWKNLSDRMIKQ